jgi:N-acetylmuramoyl-L-alanine amidase
MEIKFLEGCKNKWVTSGNSGIVKSQRVKPILAVVLHHTGSFSDKETISWFTRATQDGSNKNASAHFLIGREGDIWQFVKEEERSWHAGVSSLSVNGVTYSNWNEFSLGIELTGDGNSKPFSRQQYESLINLLSIEVNRFNIKREFVVGHEQIAPGRKVDPGKMFEWQVLYRMVYDELRPAGFGPSNVIYSVGTDVKE